MENINTDQFLEGTYIVTMQTKTNKVLYLTMHTDNEKPAWTFDKNDACVWENDDVCKKFAEKWFKSFDGWKVREYTSHIEA